MMRPPLPRQYPDGSRHWSPRQIVAQAEWAHEVTEQIAELLPATLAKLCDWTPGVPGQSYEPGGSPRNDAGAKDGSTVRLAVRGLHADDPVTADTLIVLFGLMKANDIIESVRRALTRLQVLDEKSIPPLFTQPPPPGAGPCQNPHCRREVPGGADRLRGGRCDACRQYLTRNGKERPPDLCWPALAGADRGDMGTCAPPAVSA